MCGHIKVLHLTIMIETSQYRIAIGVFVGYLLAWVTYLLGLLR